MMRKHKSAWLLGLLFCAAWAATSEVKTEVYWFSNTIKIEAPLDLIGLSTQPTLPIFLALILMPWLLRDKFARVLAAMGAAACLILCVDNAQIIYRSAQMLSDLRELPPSVIALGEQSLWTQLIGASVSFSLSALCLWLCVRAASPQQPRPLASLRDWKSWSVQKTGQTERANA